MLCECRNEKKNIKKEKGCKGRQYKEEVEGGIERERVNKEA